MLDLLLPQRCVVCGCGGRQLCVGCRDDLQRIEPPLCARCGAPTAWPVERCRECAGRKLGFASARAAVGYDAAARRLVHAWKERGLRRLSAEAAQLVAERLPAPEVDALTFVPADRGSRLERGHNPAERLALELATLWELPCLPLLERTRGGRQRGSSAAERRSVRGSFRARGHAPRKVGVVDDVYTTGATAAAAASALRSGGARRVEAVAFARALRRG
jgi:predicted amidophosphoribosyltransferase